MPVGLWLKWVVIILTQNSYKNALVPKLCPYQHSDFRQQNVLIYVFFCRIWKFTKFPQNFQKWIWTGYTTCTWCTDIQFIVRNYSNLMSEIQRLEQAAIIKLNFISLGKAPFSSHEARWHPLHEYDLDLVARVL